MKGEQLSLFGGAVETEEIPIEEEKRVVTLEEEKAIEIICDIDLNSLTPLDALVKLSELKKMLK